MTRAEAMIHRLASGIPASVPVAVVVAHPDDEAVSFGGAMSLLRDATVLQLTDGTPEDPEHRLAPHRDDREAYRAMRQRERAAAYAAAGWSMPVVDLSIPDQQTHLHVERIVDRLRLLLATVRVVVTHAYEGGHPDHDVAAYAVQTACYRLGAEAPDRVEFAGYHWTGARRVHGAFWPSLDAREWRLTLTGERFAAKHRAIAAYASQASVLRKFRPVEERYRLAPRYDFTKPPAPGCLYDYKGWAVSNARVLDAFRRCA